MVNDTEAKDDAMDKDRIALMLLQLSIWINDAYLKSQTDATKSTIINEVNDLGNALRISNFKSQALVIHRM